MNLFDIIGGAIQGIIGDIQNGIGSALGSASQSFFNNVLQPIENALGSALSDVEKSVGGVAQSAVNDLGTVLNGVGSEINNVLDTIGGSISTAVQAVGNSLNTIGNDIYNALNAAIGDVGRELSNIWTGIQGGFSDVLKGVENGIAYVESDIVNNFGPILTGIEGFIRSLPSDVATIGRDILGGIEKIPAALEAEGEKILSAIDFTKLPENILKALGGGVGEVGKLLGEIAQPIVQTLLDAAGVSSDYLSADDIRKLAEIAVADAEIGSIPFPFQNFGFLISSFVNRIEEPLLQGAYRSLNYSGNASAPNRIVDIATALTLYFRQVATKDELYNVLLKNGYNADAAEVILEASYKLLGLGELVGLRFRNIIPTDDQLDREAQALGYHAGEATRFVGLMRPLLGQGETIESYRRFYTLPGDKDAFDDLRRAGWSDDRIELLKNISIRLPDLPMAKDFIIKNLYDPATITKYGLDTGLNKSFLDLGHKLGYDEETTKLLYYSTWEFPPFFILESLYKSGELDKETFVQLLTLEGTPPYFINKFVASLAPKLTQADIKDMYKYQVITAEQIIPELEKIGITGDLATRLQALWVASVKLASPLDQTGTQVANGKIKSLTESTILTAYSDGVITYSTALTDLETANYSTDEAKLLLSIEDYKVQQKNMTQEKDIIKEEVATGEITFDQAIVKLQALNPTDVQFNLWYEELKKLFVHKPKMPTVAELKQWVKDNIVSLQYFAQKMALLGYQNEYIYYMMIQMGATQADAEAALT